VHEHLTNLERKGYIHRDPSKSRAIELVEKDPLAAPRHSNIVSLPIIGQVAAGTPVLAETNIEDHIEMAGGLFGVRLVPAARPRRQHDRRRHHGRRTWWR